VTWTRRRARPDDLDRIMAVEVATFPDDAWSSHSMASELASPHGYYLVAEDEHGELLGYAGLLAPDGSGQGDVQTLAVVERARRAGLGRALLRELLAEAAARRADEVFLEVRADNPGAQALYESEGFERIATRPRYYRGGIDAVIMRRAVPAAEGSAE
jgi:ribosomal-protein-alanine acetyltransferase